MLAKDIKPFVTLYHWDHPEIFERMGGWTNEMMVEWISDYARVVFKELGPKVKYFMSINEPNVFCGEGYGQNVKAPGIYRIYLFVLQQNTHGTFSKIMSDIFLKQNVLLGKNLGSPGVFLCMHNVLKAHAKIYHIYDKEFRKYQEGKIGIVLPCSGALPKNPNDTAAVNMYFQFNCGWIAHAIFSKTGDYPEIMKTHVAENSKLAGFSKSLLPELSSEWVQYIK